MVRNKNKEKSQQTKYPVLRSLWIGVYADILGFTILLPFLPEIMERFGANPFELGLILSANALFGFFFGPYLGKLSDKYGRKPLLLISQMGTCLGFIILAFSNSIEWILISRIVDGVFGGNFPIAKAVIGDVVKPKDRSNQLANIGVAHNVANLLGPAIGAALAPFGLFGLGLSAAALSLVTIMATYFLLEETNPDVIAKREGRKLDEDEDETEDEDSNSKNSTKNNNKPVSIFKNKLALLLLIQWFFHTLAFMTYISQMSVFVRIKFNFTTQQLGILLSIAGAFQIFVKFVIFLPLLRRIGERELSILGLGMFMGLFFIVGYVADPVQLLIVMLGVSFAASSTRGILTSFLSRSVHKKQLGKVMGYNTSLDNMSQIVGPLISGWILTYYNVNIYGLIPGILSLFAFGLIFSYSKDQIKIEDDDEKEENIKHENVIADEKDKQY